MIIQGKHTVADVKAVEYDDGVIKQIYYMLQSPAINNRVVIMPDTHVGKGSVIGFTMQLSDKVIPNIVGVDIGCGMLTAKIDKPQQKLEEVDKLIRSVIPVGFCVRQIAVAMTNVQQIRLAKKVNVKRSYMDYSLGTLGGGNHFIELGVYNNEYYLTIHTGSRNLGLKTALYHQNKAIGISRDRGIDFNAELAQLKNKYNGIELGGKIKALKKRFNEYKFPKDLAYLDGDNMQEYLKDMYQCQDYAQLNRGVILEQICHILKVDYELVAESVHNYISPIDKIIRKGAISAYEGETVIIPINRTFGTIIGTGRSNSDWNFSAPHGAGRLMSRREAKSTFTQNDADDLMGDVYSSHNPIDECDLVYKSPQSIIDAIATTVDVKYVIRPILNIKG